MKFLTLLLVSMLSASAVADAFDDGLLSIQQRWAEIQYQTPEDDREKAFDTLAEDAAEFVAAHPQRAEAFIWQGIVLSTYAGARGGLGALGLVKEARASLEQALKLDDTALEGSAYTSLGSLYYQVPGWPLSFGDDEKAEEYLKKALSLNPDGIDPNYFFGDFLRDQGRKEQARVYLAHALEAAPRPGRELADQGRMREVEELLSHL